MSGLKRILPTLTTLVIAAAAIVFAPFIPGWVRYVMQIALAIGLVSLGVLMMLRAGLLSFGQGLYYLIGGYAVGVLSRYYGVTDGLLQLGAALLASGVCAAIVGPFITRYRGIFYAMLTLAIAMIAYGISLKVALFGGTDGLNVRPTTWLGYAPRGAQLQLATFQFTIAVTSIAVIGIGRLLKSRFGKFVDAVHENELRLEYLGLSVHRTLFSVYCIAGILGGCGGALAAIAARHVDPSFAYWTTSGEFVFVAILGGAANVFAPFIAALALESIRSLAAAWLPEYWQLLLGAMMLGLVMFLPNGLSSIAIRIRRKDNNTAHSSGAADEATA